MTSRELIRWSQLHERRARPVPPVVLALVVGGLLAAWVWWRSNAGIGAASRAWLGGAIVMYAIAFLRVPFQVYWRGDASLLAQLPIEGRPLFDAAVMRCLRAAQTTTIAAMIGGVPLALAGGWALAVRHAAFAVSLGVGAGLLLPAVTIGAAAIVVLGGERLLRTAVALAGAPGRAPELAVAGAVSAPAPAARATSPSAILGALPGFVASIVLFAMILMAPWLLGDREIPAPAVLGAIVAIGVVGAIAARARAGVMSRILRDVSALDRQRLATLEIKPPTALEMLIARLIGEAALPYEKDARLMRRRFPMAYALGGLVFAVLAIVGFARPDDPTPWMTVAIGGAASYGIVLANRLHRPPIELARLSATLPITTRARVRAKLAWLIGWWTIFVLVPSVFAALRQSEPASGLALAGAASLAMIVAGMWRR